MKEVFTGSIDDLLEHVIDNKQALEDEAYTEVLAEIQIELDAMVEEGLIELIDGKYRAI